MASIRESQDEEAREAQREADRARKANEEARAANRHRMASQQARAADLARKTNKRNKRSVQPRDGLRAKEVLAGTLIVPFIGDTEDSIGNMDVECPYCSALKFKNEHPSLCCNNGKIVSQPFQKPPPPFMKLFRPDLYPDGDADLTKVFLKYIRPLNNGLCLSSLKAAYKLSGAITPP